jgi:hypothetical protein
LLLNRLHDRRTGDDLFIQVAGGPKHTCQHLDAAHTPQAPVEPPEQFHDEILEGQPIGCAENVVSLNAAAIAAAAQSTRHTQSAGRSAPSND